MKHDKRERDLWRGKVRVGVQTNARGDVQYCADYKLHWFLNWEHVESAPPTKKDGWTIINLTFNDFEAAKTAAQLKWNAENAKRLKWQSERFGPWRKVWP